LLLGAIRQSVEILSPKKLTGNARDAERFIAGDRGPRKKTLQIVRIPTKPPGYTEVMPPVVLI